MRTILWILTGIILGIIFQNCTPSQTKEKQDSFNEEQKNLETPNESEIVKKGREIAQASFGALSGKLKAALQRGGVPEAIQYCNLNAYPLTDSLSNVYNVKIQRIGTRIRNSKNNPNTAGQDILQAYQITMDKGEKPGPKVVFSEDGNATFYAPIIMQAACLNCHGEVGQHISEANYQLIQKFYPQDKAIDYQLGDLRGAWRIEFKNKSL